MLWILCSVFWSWGTIRQLNPKRPRQQPQDDPMTTHTHTNTGELKVVRHCQHTWTEPETSEDTCPVSQSSLWLLFPPWFFLLWFYVHFASCFWVFEFAFSDFIPLCDNFVSLCWQFVFLSASHDQFASIIDQFSCVSSHLVVNFISAALASRCFCHPFPFDASHVNFRHTELPFFHI